LLPDLLPKWPTFQPAKPAQFSTGLDIRHRVSFVHATGELYAQSPGGSREVLGVFPDASLVGALIGTRPEGRRELAWLRSALRAVPEDAEGRAALLNDFHERERQRHLERERDLRDSYAVVELDEAPPIEPFRDMRAYAGVDWERVVGFAIGWLESGGDPLATDDISDAASAALVPSDASWAVSLFADPIAFSRQSDEFTNGQHRALAIMTAGVKRCVVSRD
jgi:hypothetical protein